jgi:ABC-type lipoprotein export system ATPase subunit
VLKDISFEVNAGEKFVIMGPRGCGKTVLLKQLIGQEEPDEGEDLVWHPRNGDTRTMEQRAIEQRENEGGAIPNEQRKRMQLVKGKSLGPSTFNHFSKAIST